MNNTKKMPALFIGHGIPVNTLERIRYTNTWRELGRALPTPAIGCMNRVHWRGPETARSRCRTAASAGAATHGNQRGECQMTRYSRLSPLKSRRIPPMHKLRFSMFQFTLTMVQEATTPLWQVWCSRPGPITGAAVGCA